MKKLGSFLSDVIIMLLLLAVGAVLALKFIGNAEMKAVLTGSMEPELPVGSLLVILPVAYDDIQIGDDITCVRDASLTLVTHRVIEKDDDTQTITTQGIANNAPDSPTHYENVVGRVAYHVPYLGYLVIWTADLKGKIICGILIAALVAFSLLFSQEEGKSGANKNKAEHLQGGNSDES